VGDILDDASLDVYQRVRFEAARHQPGKDVPVHGKGTACRDPGFIGALKDQAFASPELSFQDAARACQNVRSEGVAAHQFGEFSRLVGG
jgi:hypothetical protein